VAIASKSNQKPSATPTRKPARSPQGGSRATSPGRGDKVPQKDKGTTSPEVEKVTNQAPSPEGTLSRSGGFRGRKSLVTGPVMSTLDTSGTRSSRGRGGGGGGRESSIYRMSC